MSNPRVLIAVAYVLCLVYLACAFVVLEWNPLLWPECTRATAVWIAASFGAMAGLAAALFDW